ncbi:GDSL esterase/lipase 2-like [Prunus dulcis]|uniref:GDSL esterase/lipase 2-like n=1 Tax=Prunus dulcis TaxID=3755 RepID=UPI001482D1E1|nr:GDSL esterase/lipase 2-like [Prunus dulcis]
MANIRYIQILVFALCSSLLIITTQSHGHSGLPKRHAPLFILGDSVFEAGNNNYFNTTARANYKPYGETYFKYPTGRFSDGRQVPDFIAQYAKLPLIPPYLQPDLHDLSYGVNFASAGSGALDGTRQGSVISLKTQLSNFKIVRKSLRKKLGDEKAKSLLSRAVYFFNTGSNDYLFAFDTDPTVLGSYSQQEYVDLVIGNMTAVVEGIYKRGGRNFALLDLWPMACLPYGRGTLQKKGACFDTITPYVTLHNKGLANALQKLEKKLKGFRYSFISANEFLTKRMNNPSKYGFVEGKVACCGSGPYGGIFNCGGMKISKKYNLCKNVSEYVFFDSSHPTERVYEQFAKKIWSGNSITAPYNLKALFEN